MITDSWYVLMNTVFTEVQSLYMSKVTPEVILWCQIQHKILFVKEIFLAKLNTFNSYL